MAMPVPPMVPAAALGAAFIAGLGRRNCGDLFFLA
jgi:hypothetical protein